MGGADARRQWGNSAAYRRLLAQLTPALRAFAGRGLARAGASGADAEDIVQETLLALHLKRQTWDENGPRAPGSTPSRATS